MLNKKTKKWILIIVVGVIIIAGVIFWSQKNKNTDNLQKEAVIKGDLRKTISVTGSLLSETSIALNFETAGRIQEIKAKIGDKVIEGDVLAVLDNNTLNEGVKKAKAALDKAIMNDKMNSDSVREVVEKIDNIEDYLEAMENYHNQLVDSAEVSYNNAVDYEEDAESYYNQVVDDSGAGSKEAKSALLTLTGATNARKNAEENLETARKNRTLSVIGTENELKTAEESLKTVESDYSLSSRNATVVAAQADYQMALNSLENSSLKAPLNGIISKINYEEGEVFGSASLGGGSFGEMITKDFVLEADIPESDISDLKLGQKAEITFDAFDYNEKFMAEVIEIEPASTIIQDVVYYKAKLKIENPDLNFKEGMSADIDILVDSRKEALKISEQFIIEKDDKKIVKIKNEENLIEREIKIGLVGEDGYAEVLSGLKEGEEVYLVEEE